MIFCSSGRKSSRGRAVPCVAMYHVDTVFADAWESDTLKFASVKPELPSVTVTSAIEMFGSPAGTQA